jgi:hypothetical protein
MFVRWKKGGKLERVFERTLNSVGILLDVLATDDERLPGPWKEKGIEACLLHIYGETGRHHDDDDDGSN